MDVPNLYNTTKRAGTKVRVKLHGVRVTKDDNGKVVHTKPAYMAKDVETHQDVVADEVTLYDYQYSDHPEMGVLLTAPVEDSKVPAKHSAK